jgi:ABC-type sugar transport system ATPase subunit
VKKVRFSSPQDARAYPLVLKVYQDLALVGLMSISRNLILNEPTAALSIKETNEVLDFVLQAKREGALRHLYHS